jgi:cell division transport system permease protein
LYSGAWFGLGGGIVASLILVVCLHLLGEPVAQLASLYHSDFVLPSLGIGRIGALLLAGALLGWLGAWLAVGRHLSAIEPH